MRVQPGFIVDHNVGKLTRYLRMMGYDAVFFNGEHDGQMVAIARREGRIILTKDTQVMRRRVITQGEVRALLIKGDRPQAQLKQVIAAFHLNPRLDPFSRCLECNQPLIERSQAEVKDRVPPYVFQTQSQYMECSACHRIYWRGTHWTAMTQMLKKFISNAAGSNDQPS